MKMKQKMDNDNNHQTVWLEAQNRIYRLFTMSMGRKNLLDNIV